MIDFTLNTKRMLFDDPITEQMYLLLYDDKDPRDALRDLLARELRDEREADTP